ncbi:TPA: hypothetical protein QDB45_001622 [Burkholderia vietnamiensis]|nr:hypothetical protein [Burkholderia vietnamiensis]
MRTERFTTKRTTGSALAIAALVLLTAHAANATSTTGTASVPTQQIDGVTFPASFPAGALNQLRVTNVGAIPEASQGRPRPRNTTSITTDLYVPGAIKGVDGQPPLAHCRNMANGQRQCVTPAPAGGW